MKVIKVGYNCGALDKKDGQELAPDSIHGLTKDFYLKESGVLPILEFEELQINNSDIAGSSERITEFAKKFDYPSIFLGGDHSLTYSTFKGFSARHANPGLIVFDAHLDCIDDFRPPTHEDYLRVLIEEGILKKSNVLVVGVRNMHSNEFEFAKEKKLKIYQMNEIAAEGIVETCNAVMTAAMGFDALYISVDIDVLDPAFAPGTGYTEPGGLTTRELLYFLQRLKLLKNFRMADIVEVNPKKDTNDLTGYAAAKILIELC
jgi:arginase family enzyme